MPHLGPRMKSHAELVLMGRLKKEDEIIKAKLIAKEVAKLLEKEK